MLLKKYKYSVNRGLSIKAKKRVETGVRSFAVISRSTPLLYHLSASAGKDAFILYDQQEYLHRKCTFVTDSDAQLLHQLQQHTHGTNMTVLIASEQTKSQRIATDPSEGETVIKQVFRSMLGKKQANTSISLSVLGVCSENMLTDELKPLEEGSARSVRQMVRLRNTDHAFSKYQLESATRAFVTSQADLQRCLADYKQIKNQKEYQSIAEERLWDWLQGQLFILQELAPQDESGEQPLIASHYLLKVNQYLQTGSSIMLSLGIVLRKLQQGDRKGAQANDSKLLRLLSNCWAGRSSHSINLILQLGYRHTIKEEYLALVPTSQLAPALKTSSNVEELPFCYIKGYLNYPKITALVSKLTQQSSTIRLQGEKEINRKVRPYARDTFSSIEKRRVNSIQRELQETQSQQDNMESIIQEATQLYKQSNQDCIRLSYHQQSNQMVVRKHKQVVNRFSTIDRLPSQFHRSEKMRSKPNPHAHNKTPKALLSQRRASSFQLTNPIAALQVYIKGKKVNNNRKFYSRKEKRPEEDFVEEMVKREMLQLSQEKDTFDQYIY